jgi:hypothetical protein
VCSNGSSPSFLLTSFHTPLDDLYLLPWSPFSGQSYIAVGSFRQVASGRWKSSSYAAPYLVNSVDGGVSHIVRRADSWGHLSDLSPFRGVVGVAIFRY